MLPIEDFGKDPTNERRLFTLALERAELNENLSLATKHFACLIAWDSEETKDEDISVFLRRIIDSGAAYICSWGKGCEKVHDLADEIDIEMNPDSDNVIMTTWHSEESLSEAIWFLLNSTWPDTYAEKTLGSTIAISVGNSSFAKEIRNAFSDPVKFNQASLANDDGAL